MGKYINCFQLFCCHPTVYNTIDQYTTTETSLRLLQKQFDIMFLKINILYIYIIYQHFAHYIHIYINIGLICEKLIWPWIYKTRELSSYIHLHTYINNNDFITTVTTCIKYTSLISQWVSSPDRKWDNYTTNHLQYT